MGTLKVLPESVPFSVDPDGTVRVKNSTVLDRETTANITFLVGTYVTRRLMSPQRRGQKDEHKVSFHKS